MTSKKTSKKYDVVIGNPPYQGSKHLDFLADGINNLKPNGEGIFIHPATWAMNEFSGQSIQRKKIVLNTHILEMDIKKSPFGTSADLSDGVLHTVFTKKENSMLFVNDEINGHTYTADSLFEISKWGKSAIYKNIKQTIIAVCNENGSLSTNRAEYSHNYNFFYKLPKKIGNIDKKTSQKKNDFFCFWQKGGYANRIYSRREITKPEYLLFGFKTKKEAINFQNYTKTYIARFALSIAKNEFTINPGNTLSTTPWMDFTESWDDEKLADYFGFSDKELQFIADRIPAYYDDMEALI